MNSRAVQSKINPWCCIWVDDENSYIYIKLTDDIVWR